MCVHGVPSNKIFRVNCGKRSLFVPSLISMHWARAHIDGSSNAGSINGGKKQLFRPSWNFTENTKQSDLYFGCDRSIMIAVAKTIPSHNVSKEMDTGYSIFHIDVALFRVVCASTMHYVLIHHALSIGIELPRSKTTCISIDRHEA